jgi:predicted transglutaminase-like cysteine proteinase
MQICRYMSPTCTQMIEWTRYALLVTTALASMLTHHDSFAESFPMSGRLLNKTAQEQQGFANERIASWKKLISHYKNSDHKQKLHAVNSFFNKMKFINDRDHWGKEDYWATPLQMLTSNGGDCEDYSIAKYFTLRKMGIPAEYMRLTYVKAIKLNQAHMVLAYYSAPNATPLILDNLINEIQTATSRNDLQPVYSFNSTDLWLVKQRGGDQHIGRAGRLSRWQEVIARISNEQLSSPQ